MPGSNLITPSPYVFGCGVTVKTCFKIAAMRAFVKDTKG
jgi:hypothetical protein